MCLCELPFCCCCSVICCVCRAVSAAGGGVSGWLCWCCIWLGLARVVPTAAAGKTQHTGHFSHACTFCLVHLAHDILSLGISSSYWWLFKFGTGVMTVPYQSSSGDLSVNDLDMNMLSLPRSPLSFPPVYLSIFDCCYRSLSLYRYQGLALPLLSLFISLLISLSLSLQISVSEGYFHHVFTDGTPVASIETEIEIYYSRGTVGQ